MPTRSILAFRLLEARNGAPFRCLRVQNYDSHDFICFEVFRHVLN